MVLVLLSAIGAASVLSALIALVSSHLRQRSTAGQDDERAESEAEPKRAPSLENRRSTGAKRPARHQPLYVGVMVIAAVGFFLWNRQGRRVEQERICTAKPTSEERLKLFSNLYGFHHKIQTSAQTSQALFDQGLLLSWDFAQPEAEAALRMAADADPNASMPHWGIQYAVGPGANRAVLSERPPYPAFAPDNFPTVYEESRTALRLAEAAAVAAPDSEAAARDLAFAKAAVLRWPEDSAFGERRDAAEVAYSRALRAFGEEKKDAAALVMAAEALMNLHPWEYYTSSGEMKETSKEAEGLINEALKLDPDCPLANHLLIHISEASSTSKDADYSASRGLAAANRMAFGRGPWNAFQGHLLHMPSHTYVRTGRYNDAVLANIHAYEADRFFGRHCLQPYEPEHNTDMLIFAASMAGRVAVAEEYALKIRGYGEAMFFEGPASETSNWAKLPLLLAHFARWSEIMQLEKPGPGARANCPSGGFEFVQVVWRYVRVLAVAARAEGARLSNDEAEFSKLDEFLDSYLQLLQEAESKVVAEAPVLPPAVYLCEYKGLAQIFVLTARARIAFLRGKPEEAAEKLRSAVALEDGFAYMEPPRVYQPVRQCLGYVLARSGKLQEAEKVYRDDLDVFPDNGWSLYGLSATLHDLGKRAEVDQLKPLREAAWKESDVVIDSSCLAFSSPWGAPQLR